MGWFAEIVLVCVCIVWFFIGMFLLLSLIFLPIPPCPHGFQEQIILGTHACTHVRG